MHPAQTEIIKDACKAHPYNLIIEQQDRITIECICELSNLGLITRPKPAPNGGRMFKAKLQALENFALGLYD